MNRIETDQTLLRELVDYKFPLKGGSIESQVERYMGAFKENDNAPWPGEVLYNINNVKFLTIEDGEGDNISLRGRYRFPEGELLTKTDLDNFTNKDTIVSIFHHNDLDGESAAGLLNLFLTKFSKNKKLQVRFIKYSYIGTAFQDEINRMSIGHGFAKKYAFVLDLSIRSLEMRDLSNVYDRLIIVDHHPATLEQLAMTRWNKQHEYSIVVNLQYSATYLLYNYMKKYFLAKGIVLSDVYPQLVSILDTKAYVDSATNNEFAGIRVTKDIFPKLIGRYYKASLDQDAITMIEEKHKFLIGNNIFIKVQDNNKDTKGFQYAYSVALKIQQYYTEMSCMEPIAAIYSDLYTSTNAVSKVISIGEELLKISLMKLKIMYENDTIYQMSYHGHIIKGLMGHGSSYRFSPDEDSKSFAKVTMRYRDNDTITVSIYGDDQYLRKANLYEILRQDVKSSAGYSGSAGCSLKIADLEYQFDYFCNQLPNYQDVYTNAKFEIIGKDNGRYDKNMELAFTFLSTLILLRWEEAIKKDFEK